MGLRVKGLGFGVWGLGFRVWGLSYLQQNREQLRAQRGDARRGQRAAAGGEPIPAKALAHVNQHFVDARRGHPPPRRVVHELHEGGDEVVQPPIEDVDQRAVESMPLA